MRDARDVPPGMRGRVCRADDARAIIRRPAPFTAATMARAGLQA